MCLIDLCNKGRRQPEDRGGTCSEQWGWCILNHTIQVYGWRSGNVVGCIIEVTLRRVRLVYEIPEHCSSLLRRPTSPNPINPTNHDHTKPKPNCNPNSNPNIGADPSTTLWGSTEMARPGGRKSEAGRAERVWGPW